MAKPFQDCIILFGDSLTQAQAGSCTLHHSMSLAYTRKLDVINRGFGGYNSNGGRGLWDEIFARKEDAKTAQRVRMVTIWHGTNDAPISPKPTSTPVERYIDNLNFFMHSLTSPDSPYAVADTPVSIVLIACQPIVPRMIPAWNAPDAVRWLVPERQREFRDAALQVGKEWKEKEHSEENKTGWKVEVLDFWSAMVQDAQGEEDALLAKYFTDGVHLTPLGYELLWKEMSDIILTKFKGRGLDYTDFDDLPQRAPWWTNVDWDHTENLPSQLKYPSFR